MSQAYRAYGLSSASSTTIFAALTTVLTALTSVLADFTSILANFSSSHGDQRVQHCPLSSILRRARRALVKRWLHRSKLLGKTAGLLEISACGATVSSVIPHVTSVVPEVSAVVPGAGAPRLATRAPSLCHRSRRFRPGLCEIALGLGELTLNPATQSGVGLPLCDPILSTHCLLPGRTDRCDRRAVAPIVAEVGTVVDRLHSVLTCFPKVPSSRRLRFSS